MRGHPRQLRRCASSLLIAVFCAYGAVAAAELSAPRAAIDWLDPAAVLDKYYDRNTGSGHGPRFYVQGRLKSILTIPVGDVRESSSGSRKPSFSLSILDVEDPRQNSMRLVYLGLESLERLDYFAEHDYCMQYEPLKSGSVSLGDLLGIGEASRVPPVALGKLHALRLDRVDGILVRIPGTLNICTPEDVFVISVLSPDGTCREIGEGARTTYVCEHRIGDTVRSSATMATDPEMRPTASCMSARGAGSCLIFDYPKAETAPPPQPR